MRFGLQDFGCGVGVFLKGVGFKAKSGLDDSGLKAESVSRFFFAEVFGLTVLVLRSVEVVSNWRKNPIPVVQARLATLDLTHPRSNCSETPTVPKRIREPVCKPCHGHNELEYGFWSLRTRCL